MATLSQLPGPANGHGHEHPPMPLLNGTAQRDNHNLHVLGPSLNGRVKKARVLMVGAGGIGCELLKTLVLAGFGEIHIVDLDTIDLSNLNRQFLFRREHIKRPKAEVAREAAQRFNPYTKIVAHYDNISSVPPFSVTFFKGFDVVFNALDNLNARRHVNRMCLVADVPLIESGTTGFNGQVQVIRRGVTACYDCSPKAVPKSFPVCTIRSTPSQPIHCIVWAKDHLLNEVYGAAQPGDADADAAEEADRLAGQEEGPDGARDETSELLREERDLKALRQSVTHADFAQMLFDKVFHTEILRLRSMEDMWRARTPPEPVLYKDVMQRALALLAEHRPKESDAAGASRTRMEQILADSQAVWSLEESVLVFKESVTQLGVRVEKARPSLASLDDAPNGLAATNGDGGSDASKPDAASLDEAALDEADIQFDKDDIDTLNFVTACANIRATLFGIERKSRFEIKQMAGNIIPAIATTNAIVAGLCVLESFKVLEGKYGSAQEIFLTPFAADRRLASDRPRPPNPDCATCSNAFVVVRVNAQAATLSDFLEKVVWGYLGYDREHEICLHGDAGLLYDVEEDENVDRRLCDLGIKEGGLISITDDTSDDDKHMDVFAYIETIDGPLADGGAVAIVDPVEGFAIPKRPSRPKEATPRAPEPQKAKAPGVPEIVSVEDDDDDVLIVEAEVPAKVAPAASRPEGAPESLPKRPRDDESKSAQEAKRPRLEAEAAPTEG